MSIYKKIAEIQQELLKEEFQTKKGFHGEYIPLPVMLPPVLKQCFKKELTLYFTSTTEHLMLKLMSWDGEEEFSDRVRLPEISKDEKDEGKKITYLKRYLLMNTFMIIEESVDPDDLPDNNVASSAKSKGNNKASKNSTTSSADKFNVKETWDKAVEELKEKNTGKELTKKDVYQHIYETRNLNDNKPEREKIFRYYQKLGEVVA